MNIDPVTRGLIDKFVPHLGVQIDTLAKIQIAFSEALTGEQQQAVRATIRKGSGEFISWSKTKAGTMAIRAFTDAFTGVEKAPAAVQPSLPPAAAKEKSDDVA